jgi:pimeloyl-ACP methyl ester carboxylesterase
MRSFLSLWLILLGTQPLWAAQPITLETAGSRLYGTLELPPARGKMPVALIIAGSGPTDRNGNSPLLPGHNDSLKLLAEALAQNGIASVRYDKRGIGESTQAGARESDLRFGDYINDAVAWLRKLRADERFSTVTVIGHSEGALIGAVAARRGGADALVSIAGAGWPAATILRRQLRDKLPPPLLARAEDVISSLARGETAAAPPELAALFRPSVQPYLISWFRYDPAWEIARLKIPVLIVQGTTDVQVGVDDARRLYQADPGACLLVALGMNHVLKTVPDDAQQQLQSYGDPSLPLAPQLAPALSNFIFQVKITQP